MEKLVKFDSEGMTYRLSEECECTSYHIPQEALPSNSRTSVRSITFRQTAVSQLDPHRTVSQDVLGENADIDHHDARFGASVSGAVMRGKDSPMMITRPIQGTIQCIRMSEVKQ
jgi:hypothetical protein